MTPKVSIIIPMYNVAKVFATCIANLKAQTYSCLEVILLNDASTDDTHELASSCSEDLLPHSMVIRYASFDENQGVAAMRNHGLDLATGKYIFFYDADDFMSPNLIERLVAEAEATGADLISSHWALRYDGRDRPMLQPMVRQGLEMYRSICYGIMKWNVWLYLIRRDLIEGGDTPLRFTKGDNMGEDMMMMAKLSLRARGVSVVPEALYYYVKTNEEAQTSTYKPQHWEQVARNLQNLEAFVSMHYPEQLPWLNHLKLNLKLPLIISTNAEDYRRWSTWYPEAHEYIMQNPHLPLRTRLVQKMAHLGLWPIVRLYNVIVMQWLYKVLYK